LLRYDVTLQEIIERVKADNLKVGTQFIEKNREEFIVSSVGLPNGIDELQQIINFDSSHIRFYSTFSFSRHLPKAHS
jgi:Cu/Ag efflux pump CusA